MSNFVESIRQTLTATVYVRVWRRRITLKLVGSDRLIDDVPVLALKADHGKTMVAVVGRPAETVVQSDSSLKLVAPFDHPRVPVADFTCAEKVLFFFLRQLFAGRIFKPMMAMVLQPMESFEGGITQIERRALLELGENCGARRCYVYTGKELTDEEIFQMLKSQKPDPVRL